METASHGYRVSVYLDGNFFGYVTNPGDGSAPNTTYETTCYESAERMRNAMQTQADTSRDYLSRNGYPPGPVYKYFVEEHYE